MPGWLWDVLPETEQQDLISLLRLTLAMSRHLSQFLIKFMAVISCRLRAQNDSKLLTWKNKEI